jgi:hypothetical protein
MLLMLDSLSSVFYRVSSVPAEPAARAIPLAGASVSGREIIFSSVIKAKTAFAPFSMCKGK